MAVVLVTVVGTVIVGVGEIGLLAVVVVVGLELSLAGVVALVLLGS